MKASRIFTIAILVVLIMVLFNDNTFAQGCAMCKAVLNDKATNGESNLGQGLNAGILYLMSFPYLILGTIGFFWYRASKKRKLSQPN